MFRKIHDRHRPFQIAIPQAELHDLQNRLDQVRWPHPLAGSVEEKGIMLDRVRQLVDYWRTSYDWREQEARLNAFPQFIADIDGVEVHYLHVRSPEKNAHPLLLTHGWPGSIVEFWDIVGPLTDPRSYGGDPSQAFHVVIPSIPGYGFSGIPRESGWHVQRIASAWAELMKQLDYPRYGVQGGDWGSAISRALGSVDSGHVSGVHVNYLPTPPIGDLDQLSASDRERVERMKQYRSQPAGYMVMHSTRPQTLSYALTDSPVGQLAWMAEKFLDWSDPKRPISIDTILTQVMIYWFTKTAGSSADLYYENRIGDVGSFSCSVPVGVAVCPHDLILPVRTLAERQYSIIHWTEFELGGHFPALEIPDLFVEDIRRFFDLCR